MTVDRATTLPIPVQGVAKSFLATRH